MRRMSPTLRAATEADLPAIVAIYNESIPGRLATADTDPITVENRRDWFHRHDPAVHPIVVAEVEGRIAAWASLSAFYGRPAYRCTAEISTYVSTTHHRRGLGSLLRRHLLERCPELGINTVLSFVFGHNQPSIRLNEKYGFTVWGATCLGSPCSTEWNATC
jgi:phosphinothricin acetyltransferase